jgi:hypothetical protein
MIWIRIFQAMSEICSSKDYVRFKNNNCKVQRFHSLLKDINSLRVRIFFNFIDSWQIRKWNLRAFHFFQANFVIILLMYESWHNQILRFARLRMILISKNYFNSLKTFISKRFINDFSKNRIRFTFFSYTLLLCHRHKRKESINHWRINNLLLRSIADLNFSESWSNFDIKERSLL